MIERAGIAVARLLDDVVVEAQPIERGFVHDNIRVRLASGREALVKFPYWPRVDRTDRMLRMFEHLRAAGIGCPDVLAADIPGAHGEPCLILSWLPGEMLSDAWPTLTRDERQDIGRELGEWTARLHAVEIPGLSQGELLQRDLDRRLRLAREADLIPEPLLDLSRSIVEEVAVSRLSVSARAVHGDLYLDNVIITGEPGARRMAGVIDYDRLMPEDPARDFVKFRWWIFERYPDLIDPLLTGYLRAGGDPDAASPVSRRSHALQLLETIAGYVYFTGRAGALHGHPTDGVMAADIHRRFKLLIGGEIPEANG
jgi:aminoglycoside phosphotransferase (APT) family kinase protein